VAIAAAGRGWNVVVGYLRDDAAAADVRAAIESAGRKALLAKGNLANRDECATLADQCRDEVGRLDGFVHCAALGATAPATRTKPNRWKLAWDTHVGAFVELASLVRPLLRPGSGIVALSSLGAHLVMPGYASIGAAKGALEVLVRYLAVELALDGIRVNGVRAGPVETDSLHSFPYYGAIEQECRRRPAGRIGQPDDVARIVLFLLEPESEWIRGQMVVADGGYSLY